MDEPGFDKTIWKLRAARAAGAQLEQSRRKKREEEEKKDADTRRDAADQIGTALSLATPTRIAAFKSTIGQYRTGTTEALIRLERQIAEKSAIIQAHLDQAFVLDDGRRVFKAADGTRVFDEHGVEVGRDEVHPDEIADHLTRWEIYNDDVDDFLALEEEQQSVLDFEEMLDAAEAEAESGDITNERLDELEGALEDAMPESVRKALGRDPVSGNNDDLEKRADSAPDLSTEQAKRVGPFNPDGPGG